MIAFYGAHSHYSGKSFPTQPFVLRVVLHDIGDTVIGCIRSLPEHCVGVAVSVGCSRKDFCRIERAARRKKMRVLWRSS